MSHWTERLDGDTTPAGCPVDVPTYVPNAKETEPEPGYGCGTFAFKALPLALAVLLVWFFLARPVNAAIERKYAPFIDQGQTGWIAQASK